MTTIGFTRPSKRLPDSVKEARDLGFDVMVAPSLEILPGEDSEFKRLEESIPGSIVVFCSSTAVEECQARFGNGLAGMVSGVKVVSIGPATTAKLKAAGIEPSAVPEDYSSYGLVDLLKGEASGSRIVLVRSDSGTDVLSDGLREAGADVVDVAVYRLKEAGVGNGMLHMMISLKQGKIDALAFSSPMSASSFISKLEDRYGKAALVDLVTMFILMSDCGGSLCLDDPGQLLKAKRALGKKSDRDVEKVAEQMVDSRAGPS